MRLTDDFSSKSKQTWRPEVSGVTLKVMKGEKELPTKNSVFGKTVKNEGEIKKFLSLKRASFKNLQLTSHLIVKD